MANLNNEQQAQVLNAQAFLSMDMTNLSNSQQVAVLNAQQRQQAMLSNQLHKMLQDNLMQVVITNTTVYGKLSKTISQSNARNDAIHSLILLTLTNCK